MKYHLGLFAILVALFGMFFYLTLKFDQQHLFLFQRSREDIGHFLDSFQKAHRPTIEINFSTLYGGSGQFQVLHPVLALQNLRLEGMAPSCGDGKSDGRISTANAQIWQSRDLNFDRWPMKSSSDSFVKQYPNKLAILERFLSREETLPEDFLTTPPFVDPSGSSYAYLLSQKGGEPFNQRQWVEPHLSFFKISELKDVLQEYQIPSPEYFIISHLSDREMEEVIRGTPLVLTRDYLLIKNQSRFGFSPLSYWVYPRPSLYSQLKNGKYDLIPYATGALCLERIGNVCWTYNSTHALGYLYRYSLGFLIFVGLMFFTVLCLYLKYLHEKNREQKKHRLALQVLSHEFRTPVSAMLLITDRLTKDLSRFNLSDQDFMTRLATEVFRLQRIIEVSSTYLQAESRRIRFKYVEIPSINHWITDFVEESGLNIQCELLQYDQKLRADPFWLRFVLASLVQNAFAHGKEPVWIRLKHSWGRLKIVVEDHGECEFKSLNQMSDAFVKSRGSKGMGLGLNIVKFILEEWGSEIRFSESPTSFTLFLTDRGSEA